MHDMQNNCHGCGGCNCTPLTKEQEKDMLKHKREMLEKKLEWVKERETELAKEK